MSDRFFPNTMPAFLPESSPEEEVSGRTKESLIDLLYLPYPPLSRMFAKAAVDIKDAVVSETWMHRGRVKDFSLYTGALGTAFLCFRAYQIFMTKKDLDICLEIVSACHHASRNSGHVSFICGKAGVYALGAVAAASAGDSSLSAHYVDLFNKIKLPKDIPNELLYGRGGFLWACSYLNKHIAKGTADFHLRGIVDDMIKSGRELSSKEECPLMYKWHGKMYWGAAHGLMGIIYVLLENIEILSPDEVDDIKRTLVYMIRNRFPSGNYPSSEGNDSDRLVHWCHGAPGAVLTLVKAAQVLGEGKFEEAAVEGGGVVWERGLVKRVGICHGISGNAYVFLSLYHLTNNMEFMYKAKAFSCFLLHRGQSLISQGQMHPGDRPFSLFEGAAGTAHLFLDMLQPSSACFPAFQL